MREVETETTKHNSKAQQQSTTVAAHFIFSYPKIGQIGFECYEANFHYDDSIELPSLTEMMKVLRQSPDCQIDISEASHKEIINEYKFIMSLKKQVD